MLSWSSKCAVRCRSSRAISLSSPAFWIIQCVARGDRLGERELVRLAPDVFEGADAAVAGEGGGDKPRLAFVGLPHRGVHRAERGVGVELDLGVLVALALDAPSRCSIRDGILSSLRAEVPRFYSRFAPAGQGRRGSAAAGAPCATHPCGAGGASGSACSFERSGEVSPAPLGNFLVSVGGGAVGVVLLRPAGWRVSGVLAAARGLSAALCPVAGCGRSFRRVVGKHAHYQLGGEPGRAEADALFGEYFPALCLGRKPGDVDRIVQHAHRDWDESGKLILVDMSGRRETRGSPTPRL